MRKWTTSTRQRVLLGLMLAALSAGLLILAFPPFNLWFLVWISFVPYLVAQYWLMPPKMASVASAVFNGLWLWGYLGPVFGGTGSFMAYLPLIVAGISLLVDNGARRFHARTGFRWFVTQGVVIWVGVEMIRIFIPIAGTWGFVAYTLHSQPWLIQPASVFGIFGVSALIILVNYALGLGVLRWWDQRWSCDNDVPIPSPRLVRRWLMIAGITLVLWIGLSLVLILLPAGPTVRVAAIQPAASPIILANQGRETFVAQLHARMVGQTREAAALGAQVIVWPEGALQYDPQVHDPLDLAGLAQETGTYLVIGYVVDVTEDVFRNEATVISPDGVFLGVFGKDHPVLFGGETSPTRGTYPVYETPLGVLGTIICYDLDFTDTARKLARQGAQLIAVPSNDWPGIAHKHYTHVVFRAVENRAAMIKADGGYDSVVVDSRGRVLALAVHPEGGEATLVADVPVESGNSLAARLGDWFGWLCLAGMSFFVLGERWLVKRATG
ncbi:MAG: apolipoprotein N-acyltransferase [Anaerolineae bacterium]|nr:apolipoprotein N-acyltransferase [Anaerolineae bacterium]